MESPITWAALAAIIAAASGVTAMVTSIINTRRAGRKQAEQHGNDTAMLTAELTHIAAMVDDIRSGQKEAQRAYEALLERVVITENSVKTAHKRIDRVDALLDHMDDDHR